MIALQFDPSIGECDLVFDAGRFSETDPLRTAMLIALLTDRRVTEGEIPAGHDLGGWWGQSYPKRAGDAEGSRIWVALVRGRADSDAARAVEGWAREALDVFVRDGFISSLGVAAAVVAPGVIGYTVRATVTADGREILLTMETR